MHLPKTGGTTVRSFIRQTFAHEEIYSEAPDHAHPSYPLPNNSTAIVYCSHFDKRFWDQRSIKPHFVTALREPVKRIVSLYYFWRSRGISHHRGTEQLFLTPRAALRQSFANFAFSLNHGVAIYLCNSQARQITNALHVLNRDSDKDLLTQAITQLHGYAVVGVLEKLDPFLHEVASFSEKPVITVPPKQNTNDSLKERFPSSYIKKPTEIDSDIEAHLQRLNLVDTVLYEWATTLWPKNDFVPAKSQSTSLEWAISRYDKLKQELGGNDRTCRDYYSNRQQSEFYQNWLGEETIERAGTTIKVRSRNLHTNKQVIPAQQITQLQCTEPVKTKPAQLNEQLPIIGVLKADQVQKLKTKINSTEFMFIQRKVAMIEHSTFNECAESLQLIEFDQNNAEHLSAFDSLWKQSQEDLNDYILQSRDYEYLQHRYFDNPVRIFLVYFVVCPESRKPIGLVVLDRMMQDAIMIMDYWGPQSNFDQCLQRATNFAVKNKAILKSVLAEDMPNPSIEGTIHWHPQPLIFLAPKGTISSQNSRLYFSAGDYLDW